MIIPIKNIPAWNIANDGVMGGLSQGSVSVVNNAVMFSGHISIENNGGFTSAFIPAGDVDEQLTKVKILVEGDGNTYQLRLRTQEQGYVVAYKAYFTTTPNKLESHCFELKDFQASFRGRDITNASLQSASSIKQVGFLLSSKQPQDFSLLIGSIQFLKEETHHE